MFRYLISIGLSLVLQSQDDKRVEFETKVSNNPVETLTTREGKRLCSFRLVKLKPEAGGKYDLPDIFFAEHIEHGPNAPYKYADVEFVDPVGYIVAGKTIKIALDDIISDRCYSLNVIKMFKEHQKIDIKPNNNVDTDQNTLGMDKLMAIWGEEGYVTSTPEGLSVDSFFKSRPNGEFVDSPYHRSALDK